MSEPRILLTPNQAKPCPFCGGQPTMQPWHGGGPRKRMIACENDVCLVEPAVSGSTERKALANWNYRAEAR
jgi:hypothetical protein